MSQTAAILIEGARKTYAHGSREAVRGVDLHVTQGSVHGLLGPNGAGKTTTLKMLLGLVRPSAGRFEILGQAAGPAARANLGFLPEQPYFSPQLTAAQAMRLYGRLSGLEREAIASQTASLLSRVGLEDQGNVVLAKFSRGMLQRLGIAQALLGEPRVVVLDEPASGLDPVGQRDIRNLMLELRDAGQTVLLSSHQLSEVEAVCDRVSILNRGLVVAEGHIEQLLGVAGQTSIRARGGDALPVALDGTVSEVAVSGGMWVFSVPDAAVRFVVDALDDDGWAIVSVTPKRDSLEDYFTRLLAETSGEVA
jgi:ABC-2 type transport system ATP-binding protein